MLTVSPYRGPTKVRHTKQGRHTMRIIRANHLGMCFGVRDAIALALSRADAGPLTILGDLVHNPTVLGSLAARGIAFANEAAHVTTDTLMVTAHGASARALASTRALGLTVVEATCPLVHVAHQAVAALVRDGYHVVIIGQRDHVEVRGLTGDLDDFDVVIDEEGVLTLEEHQRIGIAAQTTQSIEKVRQLVASIRKRFPRSDVRFIDTVCKPTKERQSAAVELARAADVVIVVGGRTSNNTRELVKTCGRYCSRVHHVQTEAELIPEWFGDADTVGITAGTSTPDDVIDRVEARIRLCADAPAGQVRRVDTQIATPRRVAEDKRAPEETRRRRPRARSEAGREFGRTEG
jgi:4-hydroxy-3-methylbut-2-en-1-yl diphosphate reductase